jgi:uncharacterized membrane protein
MTGAHMHLLLNHIPILGTLFGIILLFLGLTKKSKTLQKTGLATFVIVGLVTIPAFLTGEGAEHATEHLIGSSHDMVHEHEKLGEKGLIVALVLALVSAVFWWLLARNRHIHYLKALWSILIGAILSFVLMALIGNHGGKIRRPELRGEKVEIQHNNTHQEFDED